jgi:hypothetical protein
MNRMRGKFKGRTQAAHPLRCRAERITYFVGNNRRFRKTRRTFDCFDYQTVERPDARRYPDDTRRAQPNRWPNGMAESKHAPTSWQKFRMRAIAWGSGETVRP